MNLTNLEPFLLNPVIARALMTLRVCKSELLSDTDFVL